ncbi:MAG: tetratricopeptide repeat protein [Deltaproteobacteria bacterium]|jgi:tetratricopeptide (TPR) repeat protein|nr:tetratricopeptide repeat protein [Deltaproteobacteria bacterium]
MPFTHKSQSFPCAARARAVQGASAACGPRGLRGPCRALLLVPALALTLALSSSCVPAGGAGGAAVRSYYYFLKAQYEELARNDDAAVKSMQRATTEAGGPYYLELETAKMMARNGRMEEASGYVDRAAAMRPDDPEPRLFAGYLASVSGQWQRAEENYLEALKLDPTNEEAVSFLGAMYAESGRLDEASEAFSRLGTLTPGSYLPDYFLGRVALRQGDRREAARHFAAAVAKKPDFVESLIELALLNEQSGDLRAAERNYRQIIRHRPDITMAKARLTRILVKTGKRREALALIEEVSGTAMGGEDAGITLGLMFLEDSLWQQAAVEFSGVLKRDPQNSRARYLLAVTQGETGQVQQALENLGSVPYQSDEYVDAVLYQAAILSKENRRPEALAALAQARRSHPGAPMLLVASGRIMEEQERVAEALAVYREGVKLFPDSADLFFALGAAEDRLGHRSECLAAMARAVELNPEFSEALNYLAYTWAEEERNLKEALTLALKANNLRPDNGYYLDTLGWVYYRMNDFAKALPLLERAAQLSGDDPVVMEHLGDVLGRVGRSPEARRAYARAIEKGHEHPETINEKLKQILQ